MSQRKRICIVGGGAAGMAAAWSLARWPDKFEVEVWEAEAETGGVATSVDLAGTWINDGVQGGAPSYRNTQLLWAAVGFAPTDTAMTVSFGQGASQWSNAGGQPSPLLLALRDEVARFGRVLQWVHRLEALFALVPLDLLLTLARFSSRFRQLVVLPLVALFFGTGNQTGRVSSALVARVFLDPQLRLFAYDRALLLAESPRMLVFPRLQHVYGALAALPHVRVRLRRPATGLQRLPDGRVRLCAADASGGGGELFDGAVLACPPDVALRLLGSGASWLERLALGSVQMYHDVTLTHQDEAFMRRHYELRLPDGRDAQYLVRTLPGRAGRIEMSFNLSAYQPQAGAARPPLFQTIALDYQADAEAAGALAELEGGGRVLLRKRWRQPAATWRHFALTVPVLAGLQGRGGVCYAGAWTLVNTHELAVLSGLAAAARFGAPYPFAHDPLAAAQYRSYVRLLHAPLPPALLVLLLPLALAVLALAVRFLLLLR